MIQEIDIYIYIHASANIYISYVDMKANIKQLMWETICDIGWGFPHLEPGRHQERCNGRFRSSSAVSLSHLDISTKYIFI